MGRLVRISDATGPSYFGTSPISEEERARRLAEREQAVQQNPAGAELSGGLELPRPGTVQSRRLSKAYQPEQALANETRERAWEERGTRTLEPITGGSKRQGEPLQSPSALSTSGDISTRMEELRQLRDDARRRSSAAQITAGSDSPYVTAEQRQTATDELQRAQEEAARYGREYQDLVNLYYQVENETKRAALQQDQTLSGQYQTANELQEDMDRVAAVMAYATGGAGDPAQVAEYRDYLAKKYGLDQMAIDQYALLGAVSGGGKRADGGYQNLYDLYLELENEKKQAVSALSAGGYDYGRISEYEQSMEDAARYQNDLESWQEYANEHPVLASVDSLLVAPFQGFDFLRAAGQNIGHSNPDEPDSYVPMNSYNMEATNYVNAVRSTVAQGLEEGTDWNLLGQNVAAFLYQTGMSAGDSALALAAFGPSGALFVGSSRAAASQAKDVIDRGGTKEQAVAAGVAAGAFEAIFEKVSIDNLLAAKNVVDWKSWLREAAKQAGVEASEESFTEIANLLADAAIMGDRSEFQSTVRNNMVLGMTEEEAKKQAFLDMIGQVAQSAVGGALSGGVMGGVVSGVNGLSNRYSTMETIRANQSDPNFHAQSIQAAVDRVNERANSRAQLFLRPGQVMLPSEPGQVTVLPDGIDNPSGGGYDGAIQENRTGGTSDARGEKRFAAPEGAIGADVRGEAGRTETMDSRIPSQSSSENGGIRQGEIKTAGEGIAYERGQASDLGAGRGETVRLQAEEAGILRGRDGTIPEAAGGVYQGKSGTTGQAKIEEWAEGHIIENPSKPATRASKLAHIYVPDVVTVDDAALKARNPNAWALTSGGTIYISDAVPAELADIIGHHEAVHAIRQRRTPSYLDFIDTVGSNINFMEAQPSALELVVATRYPGKTLLDLSMKELDTVYDELNALVWGYHKADPANARAQFAGVFQDYDAYIQALDRIMEDARQTGGDIPNPGAGPEYLTGPESSVGGARAEFDPWSHFQNTRSEFIPEGANAARPVDVPTTDPQGRLVRRTASTAMGAKAIPDEVVSDIQNMVLRGDLSHNRMGDKASVARARKTIEKKGYQRAMEEFSSQVRRGIVSKDMVTLGQQLLINAANAGDSKATAEILSLYAQMETTAGQAVQAASILRKLSPDDQLYAAQRDVSELEKTIQKNYKDFEITIDPALMEEFAQQTDQAGRDMVLNKIYQNVADQVPSTWRDKWNAWRYLAMLANPRTHVRNVAGNVFFQPLRIVKDRVAAAIESGVSAASGGKLERTKSFLASPALYRAAWADWSNVRDTLSGNKYDDVKSEINSRRRIFRFAPLEATRTTNSWLLEFEDSIFKHITYADALAGYLQANGVTAEQLRSNIVDSQLLSRARDYAGQEALRATYQDRNDFSNLLSSRFNENSNINGINKVARAANAGIDAILPFRRTPANILLRGVEYSPIGFLNSINPFEIGLIEGDLHKVRTGKISAAEAIDHIAAGLTGSALFALGALLFSQGIVTSGGGDDENQDKLNELVGEQKYAMYLDWLPGWIKGPLGIQDGDNITLDWLAPEALPFFMGVELMDSMGQNGNTADSIMTALKSISDPMLELSMLQSLNDVIDSVSFSENKLGALAASSVISYFTQAIPTLGGQVERSAEDVRMSTYTDKNLWLPTDIQYALGKASARIPGWDYQQIPYIDAWGREEGSGPLVLRMGNNFLNPAYTSRTEITPVDEEVRRLYNQTGDGGVVPDRPPRYITVNGERVDLTAAQYTQYATERGQTQFSMLEELFDQPEYNAFSITDKTAAVSDVYEYADQVAKSGISDYELDGWVAKAANSGLNPVDYILFRNLISGISGDTKREQILAVINDMNVPDADKDQYYLAAGYKESTLDDTPWN